MPTRCPACGTVYPDESNFCTRDGSRLVIVSAGAATGVKQAPPPAPAAPAAPPPAAARPTAPRTTPEPSRATGPGSLVGQVLDGRYRVEKKIGEGGMSYVYSAADVASGERVAIKVLSPGLSQDPNAMARLRREAGLASRLAHPNVCHIIRLGETEEGLVYVVMPFVAGRILADVRFERGVMPLAQVVSLVHDIAEGLHVAHELKIVHRDLKPENIMLCTRPDGTEYAVVMDFGLAKERQAGSELQKLTATGIVLGTPEFMSPEQLRGKPLDPRTDIYSLALMAFEMLTGKLPFEGRSQQELMIARLRNEPIPIRTSRPKLDIPVAVEKVLLKAMAREVDQRYASTKEFAQALREAANGKGEGGGGGGGGGVLGKLFGR